MLFVIDIGNTNIAFGVYREEELLTHFRIETTIGRTADEYAILINSFFSLYGISFKEIKATVISCVVPPLLLPFEQFSRNYLGIRPLFVGPGIKTGMPILYENPHEVGADRIVNAVAAYERYKRALIVVDFGTATTFDYISPKGEYIGGAIAPGIIISTEALFEKASKLPRVELVRPKTIIGRNTVHSMQSGIIYGYISLVDGIVRRIKEEVKTDPFVVATGGLSRLIAKESETIDEVDELLTIKGLKILYEKNKNYHIFEIEAK